MRAVFDMDGTLVGYGIGDGPYQSGINRKMVRTALKMKDDGHEILIWTGATRPWYETLARHFPALRMFDEVYTRNDLSPFYRADDGQVRSFKDLRLVRGDVLFDNDPNHERVAAALGLKEKYFTIPTFGEVGAGNPSRLGGE
jgi:hydroxymethylpyrimidine pyrophosphatase-like HAD family hydrolase